MLHILFRARTRQSTGAAAPGEGVKKEERRRGQFDTGADQRTGALRNIELL